MESIVSRTIVGAFMILIGIILLLVPLFAHADPLFVTWIYGIPLLILGIFILLNNKEDKIEQIRRKK